MATLLIICIVHFDDVGRGNRFVSGQHKSRNDSINGQRVSSYSALDPSVAILPTDFYPVPLMQPMQSARRNQCDQSDPTRLKGPHTVPQALFKPTVSWNGPPPPTLRPITFDLVGAERGAGAPCRDLWGDGSSVTRASIQNPNDAVLYALRLDRIQLYISWPGYTAGGTMTRTIGTSVSSNQPITRAQLAKEIAGHVLYLLRRLNQERPVSAYHPWRVETDHLELFDIRLVALHQVYGNVFQPELICAWL
ncbi:hypothetical protein AcV5_009941 [Taiwanofungus camphoratus]|nr:hypothetical protein AcV5_009941 [Antrodia cinnamomea]KAI0945812.1 hypothetical protein AcV7_009950 [Antrodia cinnamomea]